MGGLPGQASVLRQDPRNLWPDRRLPPLHQLLLLLQLCLVGGHTLPQMSQNSSQDLAAAQPVSLKGLLIHIPSQACCRKPLLLSILPREGSFRLEGTSHRFPPASW